METHRAQAVQPVLETPLRAKSREEVHVWFLDEISVGSITDRASMVALAARCRFTDCRHETEPGCAVRSAFGNDSLAPARLDRWHKLQAENAFNSASLVERCEKDRTFGKLAQSALQAKSDRRR